MILTRGILADGGDPQQVLAGLVERLPETLSRPCPIETVLDAAERFSSRIESQALSFELDAEARSELAAFCRRQALVAKLEPIVLSFTRKTGEGGHLFGSVTSADIAAELETKGIEVDRRKIQLADPLKSIGDFTVNIKLHREVVAHLQVKVLAEATEEVVAAAEETVAS